MKRYQGKKVVIIGGTSGIGLTTAKMLVDGGARVLLTGRSPSSLEKAQKELGDGAVALSSDAGLLADIDTLAARVRAEFETIDLLFVNPGVGVFAPFAHTSEAMYDEVFDLNTKGSFFAVQKPAPLINRGGSVVLTTAISNVKGMPMLAASGASKAALRSFARAFAGELAPQGVRVNAVSPGPIDTPSWSKSFPDKEMAAQVTVQMSEANPMKRLGTSEEVARAVLFLAFDATYTTGAELPVDGGQSQF
ncbi:SDR family oxidoreductase [Lichenicola cladoniae]|uniref:SDR family oxidoreductase n=1 Tax=Lichenicola cladoniae TaxID=1484109 RepID=A0A6M8HLP9_9PROT|nr:SDR family oxidoreductase [Lichenicola cladoniae]NPD70085.1 SDR family oxidoreductase [Acetobacteraceae bacterium]QKE89284.1 SDR family oxidoreductase [Lichenicola cladoniae]